MVSVRFWQYLPPANAVALGPEATSDDGLQDIWLRWKAFLKANGMSCTVHRFTLRNIHRVLAMDTPLFKCKASRAPVLVSFLASLTCTLAEAVPADFVARSHEAQTVSACTWGLAEYFDVLARSPRRLSQETCDRLYTGHIAFLEGYSEMNRICTASGLTAHWHIVPKFHMLQHIA